MNVLVQFLVSLIFFSSPTHHTKDKEIKWEKKEKDKEIGTMDQSISEIYPPTI